MNLPKLSAPAMRALTAAGIQTLEDFEQVTRKELSQLHGMGPNAMGKIEVALEEAKINFKPT
jgi:DNA repair protein RadC